MSEGMNWIRSKECNGLVEMEKGKLKRELISEFVEKLEKLDLEIFDDSSFNTTYWLRQLIKEYQEKLK